MEYKKRALIVVLCLFFSLAIAHELGSEAVPGVPQIHIWANSHAQVPEAEEAWNLLCGQTLLSLAQKEQLEGQLVVIADFFREEQEAELIAALAYAEKNQITAIAIEEGSWFLRIAEKYQDGHNLTTLLRALEINGIANRQEVAKQIICGLDGPDCYLLAVYRLKAYCLENDEEKARCANLQQLYFKGMREFQASSAIAPRVLDQFYDDFFLNNGNPIRVPEVEEIKARLQPIRVINERDEALRIMIILHEFLVSCRTRELFLAQALYDTAQANPEERILQFIGRNHRVGLSSEILRLGGQVHIIEYK
jgi:hypothetical protein